MFGVKFPPLPMWLQFIVGLPAIFFGNASYFIFEWPVLASAALTVILAWIFTVLTQLIRHWTPR